MSIPRTFGALLLLSLVACSKLPIRTSLGELHRVERVRSVKVDAKDGPVFLKWPDTTISASEKDRILVVLYFRNKERSILLQGPEELPVICGMRSGERIAVFPMLSYCLQDSSGRQFPPAVIGTDAADGSLSTRGWAYEGELRGYQGRWFYFGSFRTPEPNYAFVYYLPKDAKGLRLQDRGQPLALE
jgi:hypothetical protein